MQIQSGAYYVFEANISTNLTKNNKTPKEDNKDNTPADDKQDNTPKEDNKDSTPADDNGYPAKIKVSVR